ncbi:MAG: hypothetical protein GOU98_01580 [Candidatus Altiarchaeota archaeon]|nr:hypothetical protein [Candidatus Altiarchaeota archaeon]
MKVCRVCGRKKDAKRWLIPTPKEVALAELMSRLEPVHCEDCLRNPLAHSAVLQVRGMEKDDLEKIILEELVKTDKKGRREKVVPKGQNYQLSSKSMAKRIGKKMKDLGARIKVTSKLVTYDTQSGRQVTRLTVRAVFEFAPGDVVEYKDQVYLVEKIMGGFIYTKVGKKFRSKDATKIEVARQKGFYISQNPPIVFIEETGESLEVKEKGKGKVEVIKYKDKIWVK